MIWEKKCTTIVMLTHLKEGGKVSASHDLKLSRYYADYITIGEVSPVLAITWSCYVWQSEGDTEGS